MYMYIKDNYFQLLRFKELFLFLAWALRDKKYVMITTIISINLNLFLYLRSQFIIVLLKLQFLWKTLSQLIISWHVPLIVQYNYLAKNLLFD